MSQNGTNGGAGNGLPVPAVKGFDLAQLHVDRDLMETGVWMYIDGTDAQLLIARHGSRRWDRKYVSLTSEYREALREAALKNDDDAEQSIRELIEIRCIASAAVLDWRNISYAGRQLEYSPDLCERLLRELPLFRDRVWALIHRVAPYRVELDERALGNLLGFSVGSSDGEAVNQQAQKADSLPNSGSSDSSSDPQPSAPESSPI